MNPKPPGRILSSAIAVLVLALMLALVLPVLLWVIVQLWGLVL